MIGQKSPCRPRKFAVSISLPPPRSHFQPECDWAVIYQRNLHVGAEYARGNRGVPAARLLEQIFEQASRELRLGRRAEARSRSLVRVSGQGELWHQKQASPDLDERPVHAACLVGKDSIAQYPLKEALCRGRIVATTYPDERDYALTHRTHRLALDPYCRLCDSLYQGDHRTPLPCTPEKQACHDPERVRKIRGPFGGLRRAR